MESSSRAPVGLCSSGQELGCTAMDVAVPLAGHTLPLLISILWMLLNHSCCWPLLVIEGCKLPQWIALHPALCLPGRPGPGKAVFIPEILGLFRTFLSIMLILST